MSEKKTFGAYIQQNLAGYFPTLGVRIRAALGLLDAYERDAASRKKGELSPCTAFLSPETVSLYEGEGIALPETDFSGKEKREWQNAPYTNFAYGTPHLLEDRKHNPTQNKDMEGAVNEVDAAIILAKLMFYAVFGFHPMCGRQYYRLMPQGDNSERERSYFMGGPRFIFDIEGNNALEPMQNNRFVNGYSLHENGFILWNGIHPEQREIFTEAFAGKYGYKEFIAEWRSRFACDLSQTKAPCGALIKAVVFPRYGALLLSELGVSFDKIRCYGFSSENGAAEKCADCYTKCKAKGEVKIASFITFKLKVRGGTAEELTLYDGKKLCPADFSESGDRVPMFAAVLSPKGDLFGLRYLRKEPLTATCEGKSRTYREKEVLALLAGMEIPVGNCTLFVPAPPKPVVQPKPEPKPDPVVQPEPIAQPEPVVQPEPKIEPQKEAERAYEQKPAPLPPSNPIQKPNTEPAVKPAMKPVAGPAQERLTMLSGRVIEFSGSPDRYTKDGGSRRYQNVPSKCDIYNVHDVADGKSYSLQVYGSASMSLIQQVEWKIALAEQVGPVFLLPLDDVIVKEGRFRGRFCVLQRDLGGGDLVTLSSILRGVRLDRTAEHTAALELARAMDRLHGLSYTFGGTIEDSTVYIGTKSGNVYLSRCSRITTFTGAPSATSADPKFSAPEILQGAHSDLYADRYALAVILFEIFMRAHPFMGKMANGKNKNGDLPFLFDQLFPNNRVQDAGVFARWDALPEALKDLFRRAFPYESGKRGDEIERRRAMRPSGSEWVRAIELWIKSQP